MNNTSSIAFEAPQPVQVEGRSGRRPIDLTGVSASVGGDKLLEIQLLEAFASRARRCLRALGEGATGAEMRQISTALRNAALSVGAMRIVGALEILETKGNCDDARASVGSAILEAELFILKLSR